MTDLKKLPTPGRTYSSFFTPPHPRLSFVPAAQIKTPTQNPILGKGLATSTNPALHHCLSRVFSQTAAKRQKANHRNTKTWNPPRPINQALTDSLIISAKEPASTGTFPQSTTTLLRLHLQRQISQIDMQRLNVILDRLQGPRKI